MALTREFVEAVSQRNMLRVKIMLKDSLLVDTTFNQFNEMARYAESKLPNLWVSDDEDDEDFSQSPEELNNILVGLINNFSRKRIKYLKALISKMYPPKTVTNRNVIIRKTKTVVNEYREILFAKNQIVKACSKISRENQITSNDIEQLRSAAMEIISHCDNITRK